MPATSSIDGAEVDGLSDGVAKSKSRSTALGEYFDPDGVGLFFPVMIKRGLLLRPVLLQRALTQADRGSEDAGQSQRSHQLIHEY
jgi:hypothetical protein